MYTLFIIILSYFIAVCFGWLIHLFLHSEIFGFAVYKYHLFAHHRHKEIAHHSDLDHYSIIEHLIWLSFIIVLELAVFLLFPLYYLLIFIITTISYAVMFYYIHDNVHFKHSFLNRYKWFRRLKARHLTHHRCGGIIRFEKKLREECPNISFGGPIGGIFLDKLFHADHKDLQKEKNNVNQRK